MCDPTQYTPALFAQDIRYSAYKLPALAQQYLRRARALRLGPEIGTEEQMARLRHGVQWFVAAMAYAIRPPTDERDFMVLTRVMMADKSLNAIMDTVEEGLFIPDDWISMFGLLTDELSFREYGDLVSEIFEPFVGWMESRPQPSSTDATTPTLTNPVESIDPPPLFLPSPGISTTNGSSPTKLKRARPASPSIPEVQSSKRVKVNDENTRPSPNGACNEDVPSLNVVPATPLCDSTEAVADEKPGSTEPLAPAIALTPAVWRVSSFSPLAPQTPRFSTPCNSVPSSDPALVPAPSRAPTPPSKTKERKYSSSRSKFTPSRNPASGNVPVDKSMTSGKLESSRKSSVVARKSESVHIHKTVPPSTSVSPVKTVSSRNSVVCGNDSTPYSKSIASQATKSVSSSKYASSSKFVPSRNPSTQDMSSSKSTSPSKSSVSVASGKPDVSNKSTPSSKSVTPGKFVPSRRKSGSNHQSSVPRTPQPNCLNLQRRLIIISPPPKPTKSTHRI